jgi:SAM-dependent methyltransferase
MKEAAPHTAQVAPSPWVCRFAPLVAAPAEVLDVACGGGRHTRLFLDLGHVVTALDRDLSGIADLRGVPRLAALEADLEDGSPWPLEGRRFAAIVVTNYLNRPLFPCLLRSLDPGGVLIYETFARGNERFGRPRNPAHLLAEGELIERLGGALHVIAYEHGEVAIPRPAVVQRLCAVNAADGSGYRIDG